MKPSLGSPSIGLMMRGWSMGPGAEEPEPGGRREGPLGGDGADDG